MRSFLTPTTAASRPPTQTGSTSIAPAMCTCTIVSLMLVMTCYASNQVWCTHTFALTNSHSPLSLSIRTITNITSRPSTRPLPPPRPYLPPMLTTGADYWGRRTNIPSRNVLFERVEVTSLCRPCCHLCCDQPRGPCSLCNRNSRSQSTN